MPDGLLADLGRIKRFGTIRLCVGCGMWNVGREVPRHPVPQSGNVRKHPNRTGGRRVSDPTSVRRKSDRYNYIESVL